MVIPLNFADGNDRELHFFRLYDKFLLLKQEHINLGFVLDSLLKISVTKILKCLWCKETLLSKLSKFS